MGTSVAPHFDKSKVGSGDSLATTKHRSRRFLVSSLLTFFALNSGISQAVDVRAKHQHNQDDMISKMADRIDRKSVV